MRNLLLFLQRYIHLLLFTTLEMVSLALLFNYGRLQSSVYFSTTNSLVAGINRFWGDAASYVALRDINKRMVEENTRLKIENEVLKGWLTDLDHTPTLTEKRVFESLMRYPLIPAKVTSNEQRADRLNHIIINCGTKDGVKEGMGVIGGGGIVGIVSEAGSSYALVIPVTHKKSAISCRIRGSNWFGHLTWDGGSKFIAQLDEIPRYADVKRGMAIETSGYSDVFPAGIFVGNVLKVGNAPDGQSLRLTVHLGTDFSNLRDVNVIGNLHRAAIDTLRNHAAFNEGVLEKK